MALKNHVDETYLKTFVPELARYLWTGETTFNGFKQAAEQVVVNDFINRGYRALALRPNLNLRTSTDTLTADETGVSYEDTFSRLRLAYNVTVQSGTTSLVLQGSADETTWNTIQTQSITAAGEGSFVFLTAYKYYRINLDVTAPGSLAFTAWLTEASYDLWFTYYWLYLILINAGKANENKYTEYADRFLKMYETLWASGIILDENSATVKPAIVRMGR